MSCLLTCFYIALGLADIPDKPPTLPVGDYYRFNINDVRNPYGTAEIGWSVNRGKWDFELAARHMSSLAIDYEYGDFHHQYGINTVEARVRWYPWKKT